MKRRAGLAVRAPMAGPAGLWYACLWHLAGAWAWGANAAGSAAAAGECGAAGGGEEWPRGGADGDAEGVGEAEAVDGPGGVAGRGAAGVWGGSSEGKGGGVAGHGQELASERRCEEVGTVGQGGLRCVGECGV